MVTIPIEVKTYKDMFRMLQDVYLALNENGDAGEIMERFPNISHPDWICNHCGYNNSGDFEGMRCPRCNRYPLSLS